MDFLVELVAQFVIQFVVEVLFETLIEGALRGLARFMQGRTGRRVVTAIVGLGFGLGWGLHLANRAAVPKLAWVSLVLAVIALVLTRWGRERVPRDDAVSAQSFWKRLLAPPWKWSATRLIDFAVLNVAIAAGTFVGYAG